jgi:hypothetical protein
MKSKLPAIILFFFLLSDTFSIYAQAPHFSWSKSMGGKTRDTGTSLTTDASGNIYILGNFTGTAAFDPAGTSTLVSNGQNDIFISKLSPGGNLIWNKQIGGPLSEWGFAISIDAAGNIYYAGNFSDSVDFDPSPASNYFLAAQGYDDMFISKLDSGGNFIWAKSIRSPSDATVNALTLGATGNIYTIGNFYDTLDCDPGPGVFNLVADGSKDIFISKMDSSGTFIWAKRLGGLASDYGRSIALDPFGNIYTTGDFSGIADFDPALSTYYLGTTSGVHFFISKLDSAGNFVWAKAMGRTPGSGIRSNSIAIDGQGSCYTVGTFSDSVDFDPNPGVFYQYIFHGGEHIFIHKLDSSGKFIWAKSLGTMSSLERCNSIKLDGAANIYITGFFQQTMDFDPDTGTYFLNAMPLGDPNIYVSKLDSSGHFVWTKSIDGAGLDEGNAVALDNAGNPIIVGYFSSPTISFDSVTLFNADTNGIQCDIFVGKLGNVITGIENPQRLHHFSLFPNPASGMISITLPSSLQTCSMTIYDVLGHCVSSKSIKIQDQIFEYRFDISDFSQGIYFLTLKSDKILETKKLIVSR